MALSSGFAAGCLPVLVRDTSWRYKRYTMSDLILSITVLAAFALLAGSFYLWRKQGANRQALLMAVLSFLMLGNVLIWVGPEPVPDSSEVGADAASDTAPDN